ncbi:MAG: hypothetical protein U1D69_14950, partial [Polynucleobacter sp.]|nr:hypothetical protein [Polynucleobacter sp.]
MQKLLGHWLIDVKLHLVVFFPDAIWNGLLTTFVHQLLKLQQRSPTAVTISIRSRTFSISYL